MPYRCQPTAAVEYSWRAMNAPANAPKSLVSLIVTALCLGLLACAPKVSDKSIRPISAAEVVTRTAGESKGVLLMDTRPPEAFAEGHLPNARNLRLTDISGERRDPRLEGYRTIIVYAENPGSASAIAMTKRLISLEYRDVRLMEEGFQGWQSRGLPVERE